MLILIENFFKDSPTRRRIVEGLFRMGISIKSGRFWIGQIEIPTSEVAKAFGVNRRTVYETLRQVESNHAISTVMANVASDVDCTKVAPLIGNEVIELQVSSGLFSKVFVEFNRFISIRSLHVTEMVSRTDGKKGFIRVVLRNILQDREIEEIAAIKGITKIRVIKPDIDSPNYLCKVCEVTVCPNKVSSPLLQESTEQLNF